MCSVLSSSSSSCKRGAAPTAATATTAVNTAGDSSEIQLFANRKRKAGSSSSNGSTGGGIVVSVTRRMMKLRDRPLATDQKLKFTRIEERTRMASPTKLPMHLPATKYTLAAAASVRRDNDVVPFRLPTSLIQYKRPVMTFKPSDPFVLKFRKALQDELDAGGLGYDDNAAHVQAAAQVVRSKIPEFGDSLVTTGSASLEEEGDQGKTRTTKLAALLMKVRDYIIADNPPLAQRLVAQSMEAAAAAAAKTSSSTNAARAVAATSSSNTTPSTLSSSPSSSPSATSTSSLVDESSNTHSTSIQIVLMLLLSEQHKWPDSLKCKVSKVAEKVVLKCQSNVPSSLDLSKHPFAAVIVRKMFYDEELDEKKKDKEYTKQEKDITHTIDCGYGVHVDIAATHPVTFNARVAELKPDSRVYRLIGNTRANDRLNAVMRLLLANDSSSSSSSSDDMSATVNQIVDAIGEWSTTPCGDHDGIDLKEYCVSKAKHLAAEFWNSECKEAKTAKKHQTIKTLLNYKPLYQYFSTCFTSVGVGTKYDDKGTWILIPLLIRIEAVFVVIELWCCYKKLNVIARTIALPPATAATSSSSTMEE